jgi:O-antigen ligase
MSSRWPPANDSEVCSHVLAPSTRRPVERQSIDEPKGIIAMSLAPVWRTRLFAVGAAALAVWFGVAIAQQQYGWPLLIAVVLTLFALTRWQSLSLDTLLLGAAIFGYVIGSRGFAQIMLLPNFPLLPAEAILALGAAVLAVQCAWRHELPFRRDPLNLLVLAWIGVGTLRVAFDVRDFGFVAIRDFALVYYAGFFFLAQSVARAPASQRFLRNTLEFSCLLLLPISVLYDRFPEFFFNALSFRGTPLIYYKGDLVGIYLAVGSVLFFLRYEERKGWRNLAYSLALFGGVIATNNRASLLGLMVATLWLLLGGRWRFAAAQAVAGTTTALIIVLGASVMNQPLEKTPLWGVYERIVSLTDPTGSRVYRGEQTFNKGDNNLFRTVWWKAVISETTAANPYVGLGFGYDLADRFVREYYPESGEEFAVRSPHNVLITVFARMGAIGLGILVIALCVVAVRTRRAVRAGPQPAALWCAVWVLFVSACFGVVLEGPMGAVVFWCVLGLAHTTPEHAEELEEPRRNQKVQPEALPSEPASV